MITPRDQVFAMIQRHKLIRHACISLSIQYLYSLKEGYEKEAIEFKKF
jgi:hypothetical protein